ncbi:MAG: hypothetical protein OEW12_07985 [Deltaproteobacteria bacterium]|nr:hypothetical protein [Deltaproteobacteria bacterium]
MTGLKRTGWLWAAGVVWLVAAGAALAQEGPQILTTDLTQRQVEDQSSTRVSFVFAGSKTISRITINGKSVDFSSGDTVAVEYTFRWQPGENLVEVTVTDDGGAARTKNYFVDYQPGAQPDAPPPAEPAASPAEGQDRDESGIVYFGVSSYNYSVSGDISSSVTGTTTSTSYSESVDGVGLGVGTKFYMEGPISLGLDFAFGKITSMTSTTGASTTGGTTTQGTTTKQPVDGEYIKYGFDGQYNWRWEHWGLAAGVGYDVSMAGVRFSSTTNVNQPLPFTITYVGPSLKIGFDYKGDFGVVGMAAEASLLRPSGGRVSDLESSGVNIKSASITHAIFYYGLAF